MSTLLKELKTDTDSIQEKVKLYNDCNRKVAILCNHKRTVGASHEAQMEKMTDRVSCSFAWTHCAKSLISCNRSRATSTRSGVSSK